MAIVTVKRANTAAQIGAMVVPATDGWTLSEGGVLVASPKSVDTATLSETQSVTTGVTPFLLEDFSTYSSTANMLADPRGIYSVAEDVNTSFMVLDKTVGYGTLTQSMRYDWPDRTSEGGSGTTGRCGDDTIGRNLSLPSHQTEIWVELDFKTQSTFTTVAPSAWSCTSAAAYKTLFGRTDVSRYNLVLGIFGTSYTWSAGPGNQEPADYALTWTPFDGNWHTYQMHMKIGTGSNGICNLAVDGVVKQTNTGLSQGGASYIYGIALGRNMNQGPGAAQSEWWGKCAVYTQDPFNGLI